MRNWIIQCAQNQLGNVQRIELVSYTNRDKKSYLRVKVRRYRPTSAPSGKRMIKPVEQSRACLLTCSSAATSFLVWRVGASVDMLKLVCREESRWGGKGGAVGGWGGAQCAAISAVAIYDKAGMRLKKQEGGIGEALSRRSWDEQCILGQSIGLAKNGRPPSTAENTTGDSASHVSPIWLRVLPVFHDPVAWEVLEIILSNFDRSNKTSVSVSQSLSGLRIQA